MPKNGPYKNSIVPPVSFRAAPVHFSSFLFWPHKKAPNEINFFGCVCVKGLLSLSSCQEFSDYKLHIPALSFSGVFVFGGSCGDFILLQMKHTLTHMCRNISTYVNRLSASHTSSARFSLGLYVGGQILCFLSSFVLLLWFPDEASDVFVGSWSLWNRVRVILCFAKI